MTLSDSSIPKIGFSIASAIVISAGIGLIVLTLVGIVGGATLVYAGIILMIDKPSDPMVGFGILFIGGVMIFFASFVPKLIYEFLHL